jgi:hypothetical protein
MGPLDPATALEMKRRCYDKLVSLSPDSEFHDKGIVFCMFKHENQEWLDQNFPFLVQFDYEVVPGFSQYGRGDQSRSVCVVLCNFPSFFFKIKTFYRVLSVDFFKPTYM